MSSPPLSVLQVGDIPGAQASAMPARIERTKSLKSRWTLMEESRALIIFLGDLGSVPVPF